MNNKMTLSLTMDEFFEGYGDSRQIFDAVRRAMEALGSVEMRISKSQISFRRRVSFAWVWVPGRYLSTNCAPLVLTLSLRSRSSSPRWKEIVEPYPGRFTHHLELYSADDIDDEVREWLKVAWLAAV